MLTTRLVPLARAARPSVRLSQPRVRFLATSPAACAATQADHGHTPLGSHSSDSDHGSSGGHHGDHYDPPGGWLWGLRPGEKYEKEGWEDIFIYGFFGSFVVAGIAYAFKEDTSIQTWALEEARRRLEKEGILEDPNPELVIGK